jgi:hypothetical protein
MKHDKKSAPTPGRSRGLAGILPAKWDYYISKVILITEFALILRPAANRSYWAAVRKSYRLMDVEWIMLKIGAIVWGVRDPDRAIHRLVYPGSKP